MFEKEIILKEQRATLPFQCSPSKKIAGREALGDAHLKNFGIVYDDVQGEARLAPVYDLVTTSAYLPKDSMALTLNGTAKWPSAKELQRLGETRVGATPARVRQILERIAAAIADTSKEARAYIEAHAEIMETGNRMLQHWEQGVAHSLRAPSRAAARVKLRSSAKIANAESSPKSFLIVHECYS